MDKTSGALTENIPLDIPPGRNGLQPDFSLNYNSQNLQDNSLVGYGWSLSIPYIQRLNKTGTDRLYTDNYFTSSKDGELTLLATSSNSSTYIARVNDGSFVKYVFSNDTWTAYDKDGTRYEYGTTTQAQQFDAASSTQIYTWMLEQVVDTNGNDISYTYAKNDDQIYPFQITYTGNGTTTGVMSITFATSTRPDSFIDYRPTFEVTTNYRITEIDAKVNGNLVRKYVLSYTTGNNGYRSLLSGVQETGEDANGNQLTLPATTFQYASTSVTWTFQNNFGYAANQSNIAAQSHGDGVNDTAISGYASCGGPGQLYIDNTAVSEPPSYTWACLGSTQTPVESGTRFVDVSGDGYADVVHNDQGLDGAALYENTSGTNGDYTFTVLASSTLNGVIPPFGLYNSGSGITYTSGMFGNLDGNGYPGYVEALPSGSGITASTSYMGNGSAWTPSGDFTAVEPFPDAAGGTVTDSQLVDINGDGLDDWVYSDANNTYVCMNTGTGWIPAGSCNSPWNIATSTYYYNSGSHQYFDRGLRFIDLTGDGLPDLVESYYSPIVGGVHGNAPVSNGIDIVWLNTGSGWATSSIQLPSYIVQYNQYDTEIDNEYVDWNGDGLPDNVDEINNASRQDVLTQINYPKGGNEQISYVPSPQTSNNPNLPLSLLLVSKTLTSDNDDNTTEVDYSYNGGVLYFNANAPQDRKFASFYTIKETHPDFTTVTYYNQGNGVTTGDGEQSDSYAQIGRVFREDTETPSGTLLKRTFYDWTTSTTTPSTTASTGYFVFLANQMTQDFDPSGSNHMDHAIQYTYSTTTGDLAQVEDLGQVNGSSNGTYTTISSNDESIKNITYATNASSTLDLQDDIILTNASSTQLSETQYYYDGLPLGSVSLGNQTKEEDWITGSTYASKTKSYNSYGLVASSTDPNGNQTSYSFDSFNYYPATSTNALNQSTSYMYDYGTGNVATTTDPNGLTHVTVYDPVGRVSEKLQPDLNTPSTLDLNTTIAYTDTGFPTYTTTTSYLNSATSTVSYQYFDGLGRTIQTRTEAAPTNTYAVKDDVYGASGLLVDESLQYFASSTSWAAPTTTTALFTSYTYDPLERIASVDNAVGSTTYVYNPWHTMVTDPNGNLKDFWNDAFGNLVNVVEHSTTTTSATTTYAYDLKNNLTEVTDASGNIRNFTYDGLNRQLTAQDLHVATDTTFGTTTYTYDLAGNVTQKVDPNGKTTTYTYDALNRELTEGTGGSGATVIFLTVNPGKGNQTWNVPSNWNSSNNTIQCVGSGGEGAAGVADGGAGGAAGGGGAYAKITNLSLTPGGNITYAIGADATTTSVTTAVGQARETYFNGTASSTASLSCSWGRAGNGTTSSGVGGLTSQSIGSTTYAGGAGGTYAAHAAPTAGGGAGGSNGAGAQGGANTTGGAGPGGGGNGGGTAGNGTGGTGNGANGGNNSSGTGHGNGDSGSGCTAGTNGGGGGGGQNNTPATVGCAGGIGTEFDASHGSSGGGGGGASATGDAVGSAGGNGGTYGGGGGGGGGGGATHVGGAAGTGGQGIIVITYMPASANSVTYKYDSCSNGIGLICIATTTANATIVTTDSYNPLGKPAQEVKQIAGQTYTTSYSYDRQGDQTDIVYPDQSEVLYTLGPQGLVQEIQQREATSSPWRTVVSNVFYSPLGQEATILWGSGATTTDTYDANHLYRLTHKVTLLPDSGAWGTAVGNAMGFITQTFANAASSTGPTPPFASTNLNTDGYWFSNSVTYDDSFEYASSTSWVFNEGSSISSSSIDCTTAFTGACSDKIVVASTSVNYLPQLLQLLRVDPNVNYTLEFSAKASATTTIEATLQQNSGQYLSYGLDVNPTVTPNWKQYSYYFSSTATTTDLNSRLIFSLGAVNSATYWLDDVELIPDSLSTVRNPSFENISDPTGNNYGYGFWTDNGSSEATESTDCTTSTNGSCSANINVLQATSTNWYVQFWQQQALATGTTYILAFDAKSTSQRSADVVLDQNHSPNNQFTPFTPFNLYPNWNHYVITLTPNAGDVDGRFDFDLGTTTGHVWFDNFHFFAEQNTKVTAPPPYFNGIYDSSGTSTASAYEIQVIQRGGSWATPLWDSGEVTLSPQTQNGQRTATSTYAGPTLPSNGTDANKYFWRIRVWDQNNNPSPWSNGNDYFMTPGNRVQDLSYTYDANGNITYLVDASFTKTAKVVDYTYDGLNRLIQASTTPDISSGAPNAGRNTIEQWTYDALGNVLTDASSTLGGTFATTTYLYQGNTGSSYANPDAPTQVGQTTITYDNNGNVTQGLSGFQGAWDWRNRLSISTTTAGTDTYTYDENDNRVRVGTASTTYYYPNDYYNTDSVSMLPTKHIFLNNQDVADITGATGSGIINYNYVDTLNSASVTADSNNHVQEVTDYTPYGSISNHDQLAGYSSLRKYVGQVYDNDTGLDYLNARYYDGSRGQFLSEDPVFLSLGNPNQVGQLLDQSQYQLLADPQQLNAYSYSRDNPTTTSDPQGLGVLEGSINAGYIFGGGVANFDIDTNSWLGQFSYGPTIGPGIGARVSGTYDPNGSLDPAGLYFQVSAGAAAGVGASYSSEAPLTWQDGKFKLKSALPVGNVVPAFGAYAGATDAVLYKASPFSLGFIGNVISQFQSFVGSSPNPSSGSGGSNISQLSGAVINYANTTGANLADPSFAAAVKAINTYNSNLFSSQMSASTPGTK